MSAIDELRRLLDERGVDYRSSVTGYSVDIGPYTTVYANRSDTTLDVSLRNVTPEQAIAATLGRGECHMRLVYEEEDADCFVWPDHYECSVCGANVNGIMPSYDTEIQPRYCPNCGRKVVEQ